MIVDYNNNQWSQSDQTKYNDQIHYSGRGVVNRSGYRIESIIDMKVHISILKTTPWPKIIETLNSTLQGLMYVLQLSNFNEINDKYYGEYNDSIGGYVHGAVCYYCFNENADKCRDKNLKKYLLVGVMQLWLQMVVPVVV